MINKQVLFTKRPIGTPDESIWKHVESKVRDLQDNEFLIKNHYISLDPAMRGWMNDARSYIAPVQLGEVMRAGTVGEVIKSSNGDFKVGQFVSGWGGAQEYCISSGDNYNKIYPGEMPIPTFLGYLGMPGMTAFFGLLHIGKPIPGDTVVVSAASGAVGQLVGQIAKIAGCQVVGIAGGKEKCDFITNNLNFDAAIDYKNENIDKKLKEYCPDGINVYFDNVGGKITDAVVNQLANYARVAVCGVISQYNLTEPESGLRTHRSMLTNQATTEGFLVFQFAQKYHIGMKRMAKWIKEGKIKYKEDIIEGLENAPNAFIGLMNGKNFGKLLIKVAE